MKNRNIILPIVTFFVGVIATLFTLKELNIINGGSVIEKTVKEVKITESETISSSIDKIYDAVVYIESYVNDTASGSGSGFVYKDDGTNGYILTNQHVVNKSSKIMITTSDSKECQATILGSDDYADVAVLKVDSSCVLKVADLGASKNSKLGDTIFTVGSPLGKTYMGTVTKGILSGKDRAVTVNSNYVVDVLQVDAALNNGNSGGPLVNINGEVIGINSLKLAQAGIEGMGFALPIEYVMGYVDMLEQGKKIERPLIGITMSEVSNVFQLYKYGITLDDSVDSGVVIVEVATDSPAARANLQKGDVVLKIDNTDINSVAYFKSELYKHRVGDTITLKVYRNKKFIDVKVTLDVALESE